VKIGCHVSNGEPLAEAAARGADLALRSVVSELAEGLTLTADPATNSLIIQASQEAYVTLIQVIEKLDIHLVTEIDEALRFEDEGDSLLVGAGVRAGADTHRRFQVVARMDELQLGVPEQPIVQVLMHRQELIHGGNGGRVDGSWLLDERGSENPLRPGCCSAEECGQHRQHGQRQCGCDRRDEPHGM